MFAVVLLSRLHVCGLSFSPTLVPMTAVFAVPAARSGTAITSQTTAGLCSRRRRLRRRAASSPSAKTVGVGRRRARFVNVTLTSRQRCRVRRRLTMTFFFSSFFGASQDSPLDALFNLNSCRRRQATLGGRRGRKEGWVAGSLCVCLLGTLVVVDRFPTGVVC